MSRVYLYITFYGRRKRNGLKKKILIIEYDAQIQNFMVYTLENAAALDDGADDYLTKPFSATELMARIRVALRHYYRMNHSESEERPDDTVYVNGDLKLDNGAQTAYKDNKEIHLTPL